MKKKGWSIHRPSHIQSKEHQMGERIVNNGIDTDTLTTRTDQKQVNWRTNRSSSDLPTSARRIHSPRFNATITRTPETAISRVISSPRMRQATSRSRPLSFSWPAVSYLAHTMVNTTFHCLIVIAWINGSSKTCLRTCTRNSPKNFCMELPWHWWVFTAY